MWMVQDTCLTVLGSMKLQYCPVWINVILKSISSRSFLARTIRVLNIYSIILLLRHFLSLFLLHNLAAAWGTPQPLIVIISFSLTKSPHHLPSNGLGIKVMLHLLKLIFPIPTVAPVVMVERPAGVEGHMEHKSRDAFSSLAMQNAHSRHQSFKTRVQPAKLSWNNPQTSPYPSPWHRLSSPPFHQFLSYQSRKWEARKQKGCYCIPLRRFKILSSECRTSKSDKA